MESFLPDSWKDISQRWGDEFWYSDVAFDARERATYAVLQPQNLNMLGEWSPKITHEIVSILVHNNMDGLANWANDPENANSTDSKVLDILNIAKERLSLPNPWED